MFGLIPLTITSSLKKLQSQLVQQILEKKSLQEIAIGLAENLKISSQEALKLIYDLNNQIVTPNTTIKNEEHTSESKYVLPSKALHFKNTIIFITRFLKLNF